MGREVLVLAVLGLIVAFIASGMHQGCVFSFFSLFFFFSFLLFLLQFLKDTWPSIIPVELCLIKFPSQDGVSCLHTLLANSFN